MAEPGLVVADEPTSELDAASRDLVFGLFQGAAGRGATVVFATHDPDLLERCDEVVSLHDGRSRVLVHAGYSSGLSPKLSKPEPSEPPVGLKVLQHCNTRPVSVTAPVGLGGELRIDDVVAIARGARACLSAEVLSTIDASRRVVAAALEAGEVVYGVTTGFGSPRGRASHAASTPRLSSMGCCARTPSPSAPSSPREEVRAMLALRAHVLALGHSGVRREVACALCRDARARHPAGRARAGLARGLGRPRPARPPGAAGHRRGRGALRRRAPPGSEALARCGLKPLVLEAKEGLALINGTQGMTAIGVLAAFAGRASSQRWPTSRPPSRSRPSSGPTEPSTPASSALRPHPGQLASARNLMRLLSGSEILSSHRKSDHIVQDAYSIRCAPQVHGAFRDVVRQQLRDVRDRARLGLGQPRRVGRRPLRSSRAGTSTASLSRSPATRSRPRTVGLASISERRLYRLLDPKTSNGLPPFLVGEAGVNSGFMVCQYTAASLVSEMKTLAHPAAVDSITSSAGQEDHVSMGMICRPPCARCLANAEAAIAMEVLAAAQACELRAPLLAAAGSQAAISSLRKVVPSLRRTTGRSSPTSTPLSPSSASGELVAAVEAEIGALE